MQYRAPGRVNIIGEHTDYNDGFVLPTTTAAYTWITADRREDRQVHIASRNLGASQVFELDHTEISASPEWHDYARGVAAEIEATGITLPGAELVVDGAIPIGGGLSSSASFEVGIAVALLDLAGASLPPTEIARICQRAEIRYAGVNCGIMDQYAIAGCEKGRAMLIDCRSLDARHVDIPATARLLVVDSGVRHQLPDSGYNDRARECEDAVAILARSNEVRALRDVDMAMLTVSRDELGDLLYRRARHVVTENQRVLDAFEALAESDLGLLGRLIRDSHASQRDDFEITCAAVDRLVEIADGCDGVMGSRQVGGGFGGCVLCLTSDQHLPDVQDEIRDEYGRASGSEPWMHVVSPTAPATRVSRS